MLPRPRVFLGGGFLALVLFLGGCGLWDKEKIPLPGKRVPVALYAPSQGEVCGGQGPSSSCRRDVLKSLLAQATLTTPAGQQYWLQSGRTASHQNANLALGWPLAPLWTLDTQAETGYLTATPLVTSRHILTYGQGVVCCLSFKGDLLWRQDFMTREGLSPVGGGISCDEGGRVYVTTPCSQVFCLEEATGKVLWTVSTSVPVRGGPVVSQGLVLCLNFNNQLEVLDAATGRLVMDHGGLMEESRFLGASCPAVQGDKVVVAHSSGEVVALSLQQQDVLWVKSDVRKGRTMANYDGVSGTSFPVMFSQRVLLFTPEGSLVCLDSVTGDTLWQKNLQGFHTPWLGGDTVLCVAKSPGQDSWALVALEASTGRNVGWWPLPQGVQWYGPVVAGGRVYLAGSSGELWVLHGASGQEEVLDQHMGPLMCAPVVAQGRLVLFSQDGVVKVLAPAPLPAKP